MKKSRLMIAGSAISVALFVSSPSYAQDAKQSVDATVQPDVQEDAEEGNAIVVTGSRIRRDTFNSNSPIQVITRDDTTKAGFNSTSDVLQDVAVTGGARQIDNTFGGFVVQGGPGVNTLSLRGLGATRTLILLNGRRLGPSGTRGSVGATDLNALPNAIVDRIEVLKDGASSIYGSDAVAGVVNIITKSNTNGLTLEGGITIPEVGAGAQQRLSIVGGYTTDRLNVAVSFEIYNRSNLTLGDVSWAACQTEYLRTDANSPFGSADYKDPRTGSAKCYPSGATGLNGVTVNTIGTSTRAGGAGGPGNAAIGSFNRWRPNSAAAGSVPGWEGVTGGGLTGLGNRDTLSQAKFTESLISPTRNYTGYVQASYDLHALGNAEVYYDSLFSQRNSAQTGSRQLSLDYALGSPLIPAELRFSSQAPTLLTGTQRLGVRVFTGNTSYAEQKVDFLRLGGGIRGDLPLAGWRYDAYAGYSRSNATYTNELFVTDRLIQSLDVVASGTGFVCRNPANGCVAAPAITAAFVGGDWPTAWRKFVELPLTGVTKFEETTFALNFDGPLFQLPYGEVGVSLGAEYRKQSILDRPSLGTQAGLAYNFTSAGVTAGKDNVKEVFGEVEVPLLSGLPFAQELTLNGSARYTDYASYGSDQTYKIGGIWTPISALSFRTTYGTSYRAPALFEQFQSPTSGFLASNTDPCDLYGVRDPNSTRYKNCLADGLPTTFQSISSVRSDTVGGAATGLAAETSTNWTVGAIIQPTLSASIGNLEFAVDYYDIQVNNGVSQLGAGTILSQCYDDPDFKAGSNGGQFCRLITRNLASNGALTVQNGFVNISNDNVRGIDYTLRFTRDIGIGKFRLNAGVTQYLEQSSKVFPTDPLVDHNGEIYLPKFTGSFSLNYEIKGWNFRYGLTWVDGMDSYDAVGEDPTTSIYQFRTPDYFKHDASISWGDDRFDITAGVRNLLDKEPPQISGYVYNRLGNSPLYGGYDFVGRSYFVNVSAKM
jgi:iron complex outermembrane recepter protein